MAPPCHPVFTLNMLPSTSTQKLSLPAFLKVLTSSGMAMDKAMAAASKMYAATCGALHSTSEVYRLDTRRAILHWHSPSSQMANYWPCKWKTRSTGGSSSPP